MPSLTQFSRFFPPSGQICTPIPSVRSLGSHYLLADQRSFYRLTTWAAQVHFVFSLGTMVSSTQFCSLIRDSRFLSFSVAALIVCSMGRWAHLSFPSNCLLHVQSYRPMCIHTPLAWLYWVWVMVVVSFSFSGCACRVHPSPFLFCAVFRSSGWSQHPLPVQRNYILLLVLAFRYLGCTGGFQSVYLAFLRNYSYLCFTIRPRLLFVCPEAVFAGVLQNHGYHCVLRKRQVIQVLPIYR